jgi:hypothetical protein
MRARTKLRMRDAAILLCLLSLSSGIFQVARADSGLPSQQLRFIDNTRGNVVYSILVKGPNQYGKTVRVCVPTPGPVTDKADWWWSGHTTVDTFRSNNCSGPLATAHLWFDVDPVTYSRCLVDTLPYLEYNCGAAKAPSAPPPPPPAPIHVGDGSYGSATPSYLDFSVPPWGAAWGDLRISIFIARARLGPLDAGIGDGRPFTTNGNPPPDQSRLFLDLNFAAGTGTLRANPSCVAVRGCVSANRIEVADTLIPPGVTSQASIAGGINAIWVNHSNPNLLVIDVVGVNSQLPLLGEIHDTFFIQKKPGGHIKVVATLKTFPSTEAVQITSTGNRVVLQDKEVDPAALTKADRHTVGAG